MPELPEVETTVRGIRNDLIGRKIEEVWFDWPNALIMPDSSQFRDRLVGQRVQDVQRRAKYIVIKLDADYLLIHLKMTGRLYVVPANAEFGEDRWVHFRFRLDDGRELRFSDSRKFGRVGLTNNLDGLLGRLGPEPLDEKFTLDSFRNLICDRKGKVKPLLLNQTFLAGIGNIYADEALHRAGIHPTRTCDTLTDEEVARLYEAIQWVLNKGIERQGASTSWYRNPDGSKGSMQEVLYVYGREGQPCLTCGEALIEKIIVGQRGTHYCPHCQREKA